MQRRVLNLAPPMNWPPSRGSVEASPGSTPGLTGRRTDTPCSWSSLSLDAQGSRDQRLHRYERLLFFLMLLRRPRTRVIFVTSQALSNTEEDYYLHLLTGVPTSHARPRLTLLDCADASARPLSEKILRRPRLMTRLRAAIGDTTRAHMVCFNSTHR